MEYIDYLKKEVENTLGRRILTSTDCRYLYDDISRLQNKISFNTLRRFFYLMRSDYKQSQYTLDVLANYCGFSSFSDFASHHDEVIIESPHQSSNGFLHYLVSNYKSIEVKGPDDPTFTGVVEQSILFLQHHTELIDDFQRQIAHTSNGQIYYYEQCIHLNQLGHYYGEGLRYYLSAKKTIDAKCFATFLLGLRSWLLEDNENIVKYYKMQQENDTKRVQNPLAKGYRYALQIIYYRTFSLELDAVLTSLKLYHESIISSKLNQPGIFSFEILLIQTLILCNQYDEALYYIENVFRIRKKHLLSISELRLFESINLFMAIALFKTGEVLKAKEVFNKIEPGKYHFFHKQYLTIIYLLLKKEIQKGRIEKQQLNSLIESTGFKKLYNVFQ